MTSSKYGFELWSPSGLLLADLSGRASNRVITKIRNDSDQIQWNLDLNEFERYCALNNIADPYSIVVNGQTEVRVKRMGTYVAGGQINYKNINIDANTQQLQIRAVGFLELLNDRVTDALRKFTATEATTIAWTTINESQGKQNGDFGITQGLMATVGPHDKTYQWTNLKTLLQDLTNLQTSPFDFEFTAAKVFNTYASIGSSRPDIIFEYPNNIMSFDLPEDGTHLGNEAIAFGSGNGSDVGAPVVVDNLPAQETVRLRQKLLTTNGIDDSQGGITDAANADLSAWSLPFEIPSITVNGNVAPFITDYGIGDRVRVKLGGYKSVKHINGLYRIERFDLTIDENDNEAVKVYLSV